MEITFLGTSTGETEQERFYTNLLIKHNDFELLIDCGDGISKQLLSYGLSVTDNINSILITHNHADHLGGLPALLTQMKICKRTKPLNLYIYHKSHQIIINLLNTFLLFPENFPFPFYIKPIIENENLEITPDLNIVAKINSHVTKKKYTTYFGEEVNPVSLSLLFNSKNGKIIYTGDIGIKEDLYHFDFDGVKYLITEATITLHLV